MKNRTPTKSLLRSAFLAACTISSFCLRADCPTCESGCFFDLAPDGPGHILFHKELDDTTCPVTKLGGTDDSSVSIWPKPGPGVKSVAYCVGKYLGTNVGPYQWGTIPPWSHWGPDPGPMTISWIGGSQSTYTFLSSPTFDLANWSNGSAGFAAGPVPDTAAVGNSDNGCVFVWLCQAADVSQLVAVSAIDPGSGGGDGATLIWTDPTTGTHDDTHANNNRIHTVSDGSGTTYTLAYAGRNLTSIACAVWGVNVSKTEFDLYPSGNPHGPAGAVRYLIVSDGLGGTWQVGKKEYYRYYTSGAMAGLVKYVVKDANLQRMIANGISDPDATTVDDTTMQLYADRYYIYDSTTAKVTQIITNGNGASGGGGCCGG